MRIAEKLWKDLASLTLYYTIPVLIWEILFRETYSWLMISVAKNIDLDANQRYLRTNSEEAKPLLTA